MKIRKLASVILQIVVCVAGLFTVCGAAEPASIENAQRANIVAATYDTYGELPAMEKILALQEKALGDYTYKVREDEDGKYAIITGKVKGSLQGNCIIPDTILNIPVKEIAADAFSGEDASCIILPKQIRVIGERAFANNKELWGVSIANTDCVIGEDAFAGCREDFDIYQHEVFGGTTYTYIVQKDEDGEYLVITGRIGGLQLQQGPHYTIPNEIDGLPVKGIGADAFSGEKARSIMLPEQIYVIGDRAFADSEELWGVYIPNTDCVIGEDAFTGCEEDFFICHGENTEGRENLIEEYAKANGMTAVEVVDTTGRGVIVNYPKEPLVLTPDVRQFFYGENADNEHFDTFEYAEDALDYGFEEWHAPCGEFCAMPGGGLSIEASSELASSNDRYAAKNLNSFWGREYTWAEGVEGFGIGESITYQDSMYWNISSAWDGLQYNDWDSDGNLTKRDEYGCIKDGYKHYVEICIVNGYAKNQKTWEENGRIKRLLMYVEDEPYAYLELEDTIYPQYFLLPPDDIKVAEGDEITFRFVIEDVYPGTTYEDTCLTGLVIEFTGRHGH